MEIWKNIKGFEELYQISNLGQVKSLRNNLILKPGLAGIGYLSVNLCKDGKQNYKKIHRLVAEHFIENIDNLPCVNHKDGNKTNNNVENLEWCTSSYNNKEAYRLGLKRSLKGKNNKYSKTLMKKVSQYDLQGNYIRKWNCINDIEKELGIYHANIVKCCKEQRHKAGGYIWKYAD